MYTDLQELEAVKGYSKRNICQLYLYSFLYTVRCVHSTIRYIVQKYDKTQKVKTKLVKLICFDKTHITYILYHV